ncbi:Tetratricopeptide repeat-containing protein [Flexibacter flexilis DSM 6793]|uniref:Tetratricopeptide repeat-containing protein n=2 Tax=Flexibacter flexilis TaxID=998 RepID=A0A1I1MDJ9_9BACT|nr:Tetratricopeptide repeat-containing protein [Flexibacter flexilis DSM 6793]
MLLFVATFAMYCTHAPESKEKAVATTDTVARQAHFVGKQTCISCHQDIYNSFQHTGKGKAFHRPSRNNVIEVFDNQAVFDKYKNLRYVAFWRDTNMLMAEFRLATNGKDTTHYREQKVDFVIGSGNQARSYLYQTPDNYFYEMPLTWYSHKKIWDLSPGYQNGNNTRFDRSIAQECMNCHNSDFTFVPESVNKFTAVGTGIGCEKCHGAGSEHVAFRQKSDNKLAKGHADHTIVNPARLSVQLQLDVCRQCHLEGTIVPKKGKKMTDFRAGEPLNKYWDVLIPVSNEKEQYGFASHAERLQQSQCFIQSAGKLNCTSCHNPHNPLSDNSLVSYNAQCKSCHSSSSEAHLPLCGRVAKTTDHNNCVGCHLAKSGTTDIPHVRSTDHFIRVLDKDKKTKKAKAPSLKGQVIFKNFSDTTISPRTLAIAYMDYYELTEANPLYLKKIAGFIDSLEPQQQLRYYSLSKKALPQNYLQIQPQNLSDGLEAVYLAELRQRSGLSALPYFDKAFELLPDNLNLLFSAASAYTEAGNHAKAIALYDQILKRKPYHADALTNKGFLLMTLGQNEQALKLTEQAMVADPNYTLAYENRINILLQVGELAKAKMYLEDLIKQNPKNQDYKDLRKKIVENM